jgi:short-subunit dehydrogenase
MNAIAAPGRTALVTGASSGIGVEFARQLGRRGYAVVLVARRRDRLEALADELRGLGCSSVVLATDLSAPGAVRGLLEELDAKGIELDVLVNNAGVGLYGAALDHAPERIEAMLRLNVMTVTELGLAVGRRMGRSGRGTIINVSSTASFQPDPWLAVYGASKAYVTSLSLALGEELAPRGVRVLTLCPGLTRTEFDEVAGVRAAKSADWMYMSAARCVRTALRGLDGRRRIVVPGLLNRIAAFLARRAPLGLVTRVNAWLLAPRTEDRHKGPPTAGPGSS